VRIRFSDDEWNEVGIVTDGEGLAQLSVVLTKDED
jgi:hypothetical protein